MRLTGMRIWAVVFAIVAGLSGPVWAQMETRATAAYVVDVNTGIVLLDKNAREPLPPASMSKLMTLYMTFEALKEGRLRVDEKLPVSQHAMDYGGSTMFLNTRDRVRVDDLIRGIIVLSGNDACAVIAEALSPDGTEAGFAELMTARARQLGMMESTFANSNGWPDPNQRMSMRDLGILSERLIKDFPSLYPLFAEKEFGFDGRAPENKMNRNPLLSLGVGADGLKTGHTQEAGYGLVGSAKQGNRRIIFAITGLTSANARAVESEKITQWAFRQFSEQSLLKPGGTVGTIDVWMGEAQDVALVAPDAISVLSKAQADATVKTTIEYTSPIEAPIIEGQQLAELVVRATDMPEARFPLVAANDVARGGLMARLRASATVLSDKVGAGIADIF